MLAALAHEWQLLSRFFPVTSGTQVRIAAANPLRWTIAFQFSSTGVYVYPGRIDPLPTPIGFTPTIANERLDFRYLDWGAIVGYEWWIYAPLSTVNVTVFEVIRRV